MFNHRETTEIFKDRGSSINPVVLLTDTLGENSLRLITLISVHVCVCVLDIRCGHSWVPLCPEPHLINHSLPPQ